MKKVTVALTGGIGAGKSTVAEMLAELGATIISGDELGRKVLNEEPAVRQALVERLGDAILHENGTLDRRLIAQRVFSDESLSRWLTALTFPGIYSRWRKLRDDATSNVIVFDAALIFEWKIQSEFDVVVAVVAAETVTLARSVGRFTQEDFYSRRSAQVPDAEKMNGADVVIHNDGSQVQLHQQVLQLWKNITTLLIA